MPTQLNKQAIVNLLIDSPLREAIKINLIDIVNNTTEPDLPKVFPTITKELEIFQKATERRMKLAEETITKLSGETTTESTPIESAAPTAAIAPLDLPPLPTPPVQSTQAPSLSVPPLDLPPMPTSTPAMTSPASLPPLPPMPQLPTMPPVTEALAPTPVAPAAFPAPTPLGGAPTNPQADEDALAEIQKELDSLKTAAMEDASTTPVTPPPQQ